MSGMLLALLLSLSGGVPLAWILAPRLPRMSRVAIAFLLGAGWMTVSLLLLSVLSIRWSAHALLLAWLVLPVSSLAVMLSRTRRRNLVTPVPDWGMDVVTGAALMVVAAGAIFSSTLAPLWQWDYIAIWGLKGRTFFEASGVDWSFLRQPLNDFAHPDYPLLVPLLFDVPAVLSGAWDDRVIGLWYPAFGMAVLILFHAELQRETGSRLVAGIASLGGTGILISSQAGMSEGPLIALGIAGVLLLRRTLRDGTCAAWAGPLLLGLAGMVKNEGLTLVLAATVAVLIVAPRRVLIMSPAWILAVLWPVIRAGHQIEGVYLTRGTPLGRLWDRLQSGEVLMTLVNAPSGKALLWWAIIAVLVLYARQLVRKERLLLVILALQLMMFVVAYLVSPFDIGWHVQNSWDRLLSQVAPIAFFLAVVMIGRRVASGHELPAAG